MESLSLPCLPSNHLVILAGRSKLLVRFFPWRTIRLESSILDLAYQSCFCFYRYRHVHTHKIVLSTEEGQVYQKILDFSREALAQYMKSVENKESGMGSWSYEPTKNPQGAMTKQHLLVLLLRLRQACSHPALIKTMLDTSDEEVTGTDAKVRSYLLNHNSIVPSIACL